MSAVEAFQYSILAQPDADAPRLVFADWLEERGDAHAELIRIQCAGDLLRDGDARKAELRSSEMELLKHWQSQWYGPIQEFGFTGRFRRGFMDVSINGVRAFLDAADDLLALPWVLQVQVHDAAANADALQALAASPHLSRVRTLDLNRSKVGNGGLEILCSSPHRFRPVSLHLNSNNISSRGLQALLQGLDVSRLEELRLSTNGIGEQGVLDLSRCARCISLRTLDLSYNPLRSTGGEYLAESRYLNRLKALYVRGSSIGPRGKKALRRRFGPRVHMGNLSLPF